jgi:hypothetical protein
MKKDKNGHCYVDVDNVRLTFTPAKDRPEAKNWSGKDVIRIQAYQVGEKGDALHMGAEFPIGDGDAMLRLISGICQLYVGRSQ